MDEPFGPRFYEWWSGLHPIYRYGVAVTMLAVAGLIWYLDCESGVFVWLPLLGIGVTLLLLARAGD
jgi:hypothetical protein